MLLLKHSGREALKSLSCQLHFLSSPFALNTSMAAFTVSESLGYEMFTGHMMSYNIQSTKEGNTAGATVATASTTAWGGEGLTGRVLFRIFEDFVRKFSTKSLSQDPF